MKFLGLWGRGTPKSENEPAQAPRRMGMARLRAHAQRMFKSAEVSRLDKWDTQPLTPDDYISRQLRILVARSRNAWANNDYAKNFVRLVRQNVVGATGIMLQAQFRKVRGSQLDKPLNDALEAAWKEWSKPENCDVTGKLSLWKIQRLVMNTTARDGEFIVRMIFGADAGPWGFALQLIDPMRLPPDYDVARLANGGFIRHGIEFNRYGRALRYHFGSTDESDSTYYQIGGRGYITVPADEIIHGFLEDFVGQRRGLPWMATSLGRLHNLTGFESASLANARAGANMMGFIEWAEGMGPECDDGDEVGDVANTIDAEPLSFHELPAGASLKEFKPNYPNGEYAIFNKTALRGVAAGLGVSYNNLVGDLENVNFSSIRQGTLDEREHWKDLQTWLIETLLQRVYAAWLPRALLAGRIAIGSKAVSASRLNDLKMVSWQGRRWQWIDPRADVDAAVTSKNNMLTSPGQIIREGGRDPMEVWNETASDLREQIDAMVAHGIDRDKAENMVLLAHSVGRLPLKENPATPPETGAAKTTKAE